MGRLVMVTNTSIIGDMYKALMTHIRGYVEPQYGEYDEDPISGYSTETCVEHARRYLARFGRSSRPGEERRDLIKAAHYLAVAIHRLDKHDNRPVPAEVSAPSFADAPVTIGEIKSAKTRAASDWTPREALVMALREHDNGTRKITDMVVGYTYECNDRNEPVTGYIAATPNAVVTLGLLEITKFNLERDIRRD